MNLFYAYLAEMEIPAGSNEIIWFPPEFLNPNEDWIKCDWAKGSQAILSPIYFVIYLHTSSYSIHNVLSELK